ncbi:MAG: PEGA domain-containing protein [Paracoccaceae bacterium]
MTKLGLFTLILFVMSCGGSKNDDSLEFSNVGTVLITSSPSGATAIGADGVNCASTPCSIEISAKKTSIITVSKTRCQSESRSLRAVPGQPYTLHINLRCT